jgi:hypothetical protein
MHLFAQLVHIIQQHTNVPIQQLIVIILLLLQLALQICELQLLRGARVGDAVPLLLNLQQGSVQHKDSGRDGSAWGHSHKNTGDCRADDASGSH